MPMPNTELAHHLSDLEFKISLKQNGPLYLQQAHDLVKKEMNIDDINARKHEHPGLHAFITIHVWLGNLAAHKFENEWRQSIFDKFMLMKSELHIKEIDLVLKEDPAVRGFSALDKAKHKQKEELERLKKERRKDLRKLEEGQKELKRLEEEQKKELERLKEEKRMMDELETKIIDGLSEFRLKEGADGRLVPSFDRTESSSKGDDSEKKSKKNEAADKERLDNVKEVETWIKDDKLPENPTYRNFLNTSSTEVWLRQQQIWCPKGNQSGRDIQITQPDVYLKVVVEARAWYHVIREQLAKLYVYLPLEGEDRGGHLARKYEGMLKLLPAFRDEASARALEKYDQWLAEKLGKYDKGLSNNKKAYNWKAY